MFVLAWVAFVPIARKRDNTREHDLVCISMQNNSVNERNNLLFQQLMSYCVGKYWLRDGMELRSGDREKTHGQCVIAINQCLPGKTSRS